MKVFPSIIILAMLTNSQSLFAQWKLGTYSILFEAKNMGFTVKGGLSGLEFNLNSKSDSLEDAEISGSVPVKTLNTQNNMRDRHLMEPDYFNAAKFPKMILESNSILKKGEDRFVGNFKLTLKGIPKKIELPFTFKTTDLGKKAILNGRFRINRRDFNIGGSSLILSDNIDVQIQINLIK